MKKCTHTPPCQLTCRICGEDLPEWGIYQENPENNYYKVFFKNGAEHMVPATSEKEAIEIAVMGLCRSAGLCRKHLVEPISVSFMCSMKNWEKT
jgi:hypothetical protein